MISSTSTKLERESADSVHDLNSLPLLYEDDDEGDMGDSNPHFLSTDILLNGMRAHLRPQPQYRVYANMNLYYHPKELRAYISPDVMVVTPYQALSEDVTSYRIDETGPAPVAATEILSQRSRQQRDLAEKVTLYATLRIAEYILVDVTGVFLPQRLLLKRLKPDGTWTDMQDAHGGITSQLGFRVIIEADGQLRVLDAATGRPYARPGEAQEEADKRKDAEERVRELEAELARLRQMMQDRQNP